ncbi:MAG: hypothetical protein HKN95_07065 [Acidimicrobiia bacterium]|nr:hypothetical protein [Acidimicrobiia bacterium]
MRKTIVIAIVAVLAVGLVAAPAAAARGGNPGSPINEDLLWADGDLLGTIFQKSLKYNGNESSYDKLFMVPGQNPVAEAAPGNSDYNGGRWLPTPVVWNVAEDARPVLTSYADVHQAELDGLITIGDPMTGAAFLCPLIPNH